jgi:hypothetical protein
LRLLGKSPCESEKIPEDIKHIRTAVFKDIFPALKSIPHLAKECKQLNPKILEGLGTYTTRFADPVGDAAILFHDVTHAVNNVRRLKVDIIDIVDAYDNNNPTKAGFYIGSIISTLFGKPGDILL